MFEVRSRSNIIQTFVILIPNETIKSTESLFDIKKKAKSNVKVENNFAARKILEK